VARTWRARAARQDLLDLAAATRIFEHLAERLFPGQGVEQRLVGERGIE
jgi:hypothetical protein